MELIQNHELTASFLTILFPEMENEFIEIRGVHSIDKEVYPYFLESRERLVKELGGMDALKKITNVYIGVCPRSRKEGTKDAVSRAHVLWLDLDVKNPQGSEKQDVLKRLEGFVFPPTIIVDSGNGYHAYWALKESESDKKLIEQYLRSLADALGADKSCCEVARVLRLPGTLNRKVEHAPLDVRIVRLDANRTYNLSDFDLIIGSDLKDPHPSSQDFKNGAVEFIAQGKRNTVLTSLGGTLRKKGINPEVLADMLKVANSHLCRPPLSETEVLAIAKSVGRYPINSDSATHISKGVTESKWMTATALSAQTFAEILWVWKGYIAQGMVTLLSARPKIGKTTLFFNFLKSLFNKQQFLGCATSIEGKVLLLTEEPVTLIKRRLDRMGLVNNDFLIILRFSIQNWNEAMDQIRRAIETEQVVFVVVDTLAAFWGVEVENDASEVIKALQLLQVIAQEKNIAVLLIHHLRKMSGEEGTAHRGSGALLGAVDIGLELYKNPNTATRRNLKSMSRFEETPAEVLIELKEAEGYVSLGAPSQVERSEVKQMVLDALPGPNDEPINRDKLSEEFDPKPSASILKEVLAELVDDDSVERHGKGVKNSPYLYRKKAD